MAQQLIPYLARIATSMERIDSSLSILINGSSGGDDAKTSNAPIVASAIAPTIQASASDASVAAAPAKKKKPATTTKKAASKAAEPTTESATPTPGGATEDDGGATKEEKPKKTLGGRKRKTADTTTPTPAAGSSSDGNADASATAAETETAPPPAKKPSIDTKPMHASAALTKLFGLEPGKPVTRSDIKSRMFGYVSEHKLHSVDEKRKFTPNAAILEVLPELDPKGAYTVFGVQKYLFPHLTPVEGEQIE